jgi:hypothetical protein
MERHMACNNRIRSLLLGGALLAATGMASAAHADMVFANATDESVVFTFHCAGGTYDRWTVPSGQQLSLYCNNGADAASVRIVTREPDGSQTTVSGTVFDGRTYRIEFDADGDVSYRRIG